VATKKATKSTKSPQSVAEKERADLKQQEDDLGELVQISYEDLTPEQRAELSRSVLFPETHTTEIEVLGFPRTLRPTTIKVSRQLEKLTKPITVKLDEAERRARQLRAEGKDPDAEEDEDLDVDEDLLQALKAATACLAEWYDWEDVVAAVKEEDISQTELQAVVYNQVGLNGQNDSFLRPLRVVIRMLQVGEIAAVVTSRLENMSIMLPSSNIGKESLLSS